MRQIRCVAGVFVLAVLVFTVGCPPKDAELVVDQASLSIDPESDEGTITIRNTGGGDLEWSVEADVDWITFDQDEGTGDADVNAIVDRQGLQALSMNNATITVRSSGGTVQIPVVVASAIAALPPEYMPFQTGNIWRFGYDYSGYKDASASLLSSFLKEGGEDYAVMVWEVIGQSTVNGLTVWQLNISFPGLYLPTSGGVSVDSPLAIDTWWVSVDGVWYLTLDQDKLAALPNTAELVPFVELVKLPGKLMYFLYSGRMMTLISDITDVTEAAADEAATYDDALNAFMDSLYVDEDEDGYYDTIDLAPLFPILNAFGAEFEDYANPNPLLSDGVELAADIASFVEPVSSFMDEAEAIVNEAADALNALPEPEDPEESLLALGESFGNAFDEYQNDDPLIEGIVVTLAVAARNDRVFADFGSTEDDAEALQCFYEDVMSFVFPYEEEYAVKTFEALKALELKAIGDFVIGSYIGLEPEDVDELIAFIYDYETDNALVISHQTALLEVLDAAREVVVVLQTYKLGDFHVTNLKAFSEDLKAWTAQYLVDNPEDVIAQGADIIAGAFDDIVAELLDLEPYVQEITADIDQLTEDAQNPSEAVFELPPYKQMFGDLATFFEDYAGTTQGDDDALASVLGIYLGAAEDIVQILIDLNTELENAIYWETSDSLSNLLPDWPYVMELSDFGVGEQSDCLAAQVSIPEPSYEEKEAPVVHVVPIAIWSRNLGPVLFETLPLQSATVNGVDYRR